MDSCPVGSQVVVSLTKIARSHEDKHYHELMSTWLVGIASHLPAGGVVGWQMRVPEAGMATMEAFGGPSLQERDLAWALAEMGWTEGVENGDGWQGGAESLLYDVDYPDPPSASVSPAGFVADAPQHLEEDERFASFVWPMARSGRFVELVEAMREDGCVLRWVAGSAAAEERRDCMNRVRASWLPSASITAEQYIGNPSKARLLVLAPRTPSFRLAIALEQMLPGARLRFLGAMADDEARALWDAPLVGADVLPERAARISCIDPLVADDMVVGLVCAEREADPIPAEHERPAGEGLVTLGEALWSDGIDYPVRLDPRDHHPLRPHFRPRMPT